MNQRTPAKRFRQPAAIDLTAIYALENGWIDGHGLVPKREQLDRFAIAWKAYWPADLPQPFVYPTEAGGVLLEWDHGDLDLSIECDLGATSCELFSGQANLYQALPMSSEADWAELVAAARLHIFNAHPLDHGT